MVPTLNVFRMSLYERGAYSPNETFVGLKNFQHLLRDAQFIRSMQNMILLVVTVTLITFAFALDVYKRQAWTPPKRRASMLLAVSEWRRLRNQ